MKKCLFGFVFLSVCCNIVMPMTSGKVQAADEILKFNIINAARAISRMEQQQTFNTSSYVQPLSERCVSKFGIHSIPSKTESSTCDCAKGYIFGENDQCIRDNSADIQCQLTHGIHSKSAPSKMTIPGAPSFNICICEPGYTLLGDNKCYLGSTPTEACQNIYGIDSHTVKNGVWNECHCDDGFKLIDKVCHETVWHKIRNFFRLLF